MITYKTTLEDIDANKLKGFFNGWKDPLTPEQHYKILKNSSFFVLAYDEEKKKAVGFINALSDGVEFAFIPMLEVLPEYQHRGIASKLIKTMLDSLKDMSCIDLTCDLEMQKFYEQFGMFKSNGMIIRK